MITRGDHKRSAVARYKRQRHCESCDCDNSETMLIFVNPGTTEIRTISSICQQAWHKVLAEVKELEIICTHCYKERQA